MTKADEIKNAVSAAMGLRQALMRMRTVLGQPAATALVCETHAEQILAGNLEASELSPDELRAVRRRVTKQQHVLQLIQSALGDRTMQISEIYRTVVSLGAEDHPTLRHYIGNRINKHSAGKGDQLFIKVRHGWYRRRRANETPTELRSLVKGELVKTVYDALRGDALTTDELAIRLAAEKLLPPDRCERSRIQAVLVNHSVRGTKCFERVPDGDVIRFRQIRGRAPTVQTTRDSRLQAMCMILKNGPLSSSEICARLGQRKVTGEEPPSELVTRWILRDNSGRRGRKLFRQLSTRIFALEQPDLLQQILKVVRRSTAMSPRDVTSRLGDIGHSFPETIVQKTMRRNAGSGLALVRVTTGLYARNPDYKKKS